MWHTWERFLFYRVLFRNPEEKRPRGKTGRVDLQGDSENELLSTGLIWFRTRLSQTRQWNSSFIKFREFIENLKRYLFLNEH
jgi:transposase